MSICTVVIIDLNDTSTISTIGKAVQPLEASRQISVKVQWIFTEQLQGISNVIQLISPGTKCLDQIAFDSWKEMNR